MNFGLRQVLAPLVLWTMLLGGCGSETPAPAETEGEWIQGTVPESPFPHLRLSPHPARLVATLASRPVALDDSVALRGIIDLDVRGDTIAVIDSGDRVVFFDRDLQLLAVYGRSGQAPGEFRGPHGVQFVSEGLVITDNGNARATWLRHDLTVIRTTPSPPAFGHGLVVLPDNAGILLPASRGAHHMVQIDSVGQTRPFGERSTPAAVFPGLPASATRGLLPDRIEPFEGGVLLLNGESGELVQFNVDGTLKRGFALPREFREEYFSETGVYAQEAAGSGRPRSVTFRERFGVLSVGENGRVLILRPGTASPERQWVGALIDLQRQLLHPLVADLPATQWSDGSVGAGSLEGSEVVIGTLSGSLYRLRIEIPS